MSNLKYCVTGRGEGINIDMSGNKVTFIIHFLRYNENNFSVFFKS